GVDVVAGAAFRDQAYGTGTRHTPRVCDRVTRPGRGVPIYGIYGVLVWRDLWRACWRARGGRGGDRHLAGGGGLDAVGVDVHRRRVHRVGRLVLAVSRQLDPRRVPEPDGHLLRLPPGHRLPGADDSVEDELPRCVGDADPAGLVRGDVDLRRPRRVG